MLIYKIKIKKTYNSYSMAVVTYPDRNGNSASGRLQAIFR